MYCSLVPDSSATYHFICCLKQNSDGGRRTGPGMRLGVLTCSIIWSSAACTSHKRWCTVRAEHNVCLLPILESSVVQGQCSFSPAHYRLAYDSVPNDFIACYGPCSLFLLKLRWVFYGLPFIRGVMRVVLSLWYALNVNWPTINVSHFEIDATPLMANWHPSVWGVVPPSPLGLGLEVI